MTATASLSEDGRTVLLALTNWQGTFPVENLPAQLAFYRRMRDRKGGRYAAFYQPTLDALEALAREIGPAPPTDDKPAPASPSLAVSRPSRPVVHTAGHGEPQLPLGL